MDEPPNSNEPPARNQPETEPNGIGPPKTDTHNPETHQATIGNETESVAMTVVSTVAVYSNTDPTQMTPLATVIDPDALDMVFHSCEPDLQVTFPYANYEVTVHGTNDITLTQITD